MQEEFILHLENGNHIAAFDYHLANGQRPQSNPFAISACKQVPTTNTKLLQRVKLLQVRPAVLPSPDTSVLKQQQEKEKQEEEQPGFLRKYVCKKI